MAQTKTDVLEQKIEALEKGLGELQGAVRRLSEQHRDILKSLSRLAEFDSELKRDLETLRASGKTQSMVERY